MGLRGLKDLKKYRVRLFQGYNFRNKHYINLRFYFSKIVLGIFKF